MIICKNCEAQYEGNFCPNCGQKTNEGRIVFRESARDVLEHYFDFDAPLFRTIKGMITNPGKLVREYISGKRKSYSHPFRYYILVLAIYLILKSVTDFDPIETFSQAIGAREMPNPDSPATKASQFFSKHINIFLVNYALTLALFNKLFNRKAGYYFVEYLALGFFITAQYIFFSIFITGASVISPYFFLLNYLVLIFYPMYVMVSFHKGNLFLRIIKAFFTAILGWLLYVIISQFIARFIVLTFGL